MHRNRFVCLSLAGLFLALLAAGCGGSSAVTGPETASPVAGNAVVQGTVTGASAGLQVGVVGTPLVAPVDEEGQFALAGVPPGTATLRFEGSGIDARVPVPGLQDGLVTSVTVQLSGGTAQLSGTPSCTPTAETFFSGTIDSIAGPRLVVAGRTVDAGQVKKVWRGERRIQLSELQAGEKVKVWGTLRGDGVVLAEEIAALTTGPGSTGETWVSFTGKVESVGASSLDVQGNPNVGSNLVVKGITVRTDAPDEGQAIGRQPDEPRRDQGRADRDGRGLEEDRRLRPRHADRGRGHGHRRRRHLGRLQGPGGGVVALDAAPGVHGACILKMKVAGRYVQTDGSTVFKWSDGSVLDPYAVASGDQAYVEGWSKPEGYVLATKVVLDKR